MNKSIRGGAAVAVALALSPWNHFVMFPIILSMFIGYAIFATVLLLVGFSGVFWSTLCLLRARRRLGSVIMLVLVLTFSISKFYSFGMFSEQNLKGSATSLLLIFLTVAIGGGAAVWCFFRQPLGKSPEPTTEGGGSPKSRLTP